MSSRQVTADRTRSRCRLTLLMLPAVLLSWINQACAADAGGAATGGVNEGMVFVYWLIAFVGSIIALVFAIRFFKSVMAADEGTKEMIEIAAHVRTGANAYLWQQYKIVAMFFVVIVCLLAFMAFKLEVQSPWVPFAFLTGGFFSGLAGWFGMKTATWASSRTTAGAQKSLNQGLQVAFRAGAVMGLTVVGLGLLDITLWFAVLYWIVPWLGYGEIGLVEITVTMLCFGMGASSQALFARVGGGIFTKAADVGADLVGKVEAGIPEDDKRNPATIADNVGDNVGDVAGMGADLYESYCGSILATAALGVAAFASGALVPDEIMKQFATPEQAIRHMQLSALFLPMVLAGVGIVLSIIGIYMVRTEEQADQKTLLKALARGVNLSSVLIVVAAFAATHFLMPPEFLMVAMSVVVGLVAGWLIGKWTEYCTSDEFSPTKELADQALTGPATLIIGGIADGMKSVWFPVITVGTATLLAFGFAANWEYGDPQWFAMGLYGVGIAAVGMLSTLGITLATDAYGPIADNAGGNAEMSKLGPEVRERTDALDSLGNTTAATGKGFAIGSAALTALALLASYIEVIRIELVKAGTVTMELANGISVATKEASLADFMTYYNVTLLNPVVLISIFIGSMVAFLFCGLTVAAVGKAAGLMVEEVRRQFRESDEILKGTKEPDYKRCVSISTLAAQKEMIIPSIIAITVPIVMGLLFGVAGVIGLLVGGLATGFVLAVFLANSGGAWDNAKQFIEEGNHGGKGSSAHKASVIGDTVGDPFKDTSGPSLNILIKLMSIVAIAMAGVTVALSLI